MAAPGDAFMGDIALYGFQFAPYQWTFCAGQFLAIAQNQALYSLIGTFYGGDGRVSMGLPALSSRATVGFNVGGGVGLTPYAIGEKLGFEYIKITQSTMPAHNHGATFTAGGGGTPPSGTLSALTSGPTTATPSASMHITGGGGNLMFSTGPSGFQQEVELGGLTVSGGGSSGGTVSLLDTGGSQDHYNMAPFQAVNFSICEFGLYPSRNLIRSRSDGVI
jgi:microcystin-dependent protein